MQKLTNYFSSLKWHMKLGGGITCLAMAHQFPKVTKMVKIAKNGHLTLFLPYINGHGGGYKLILYDTKSVPRPYIYGPLQKKWPKHKFQGIWSQPTHPRPNSALRVMP